MFVTIITAPQSLGHIVFKGRRKKEEGRREG
jgi:hypothetical protein